MTVAWKHQCRLPGEWRIKLRRAKPGAIWACRCGTWWQLSRRSLIPGHSHWEWTLIEDDEQPDGERETDTYTNTERSDRDTITTDGGYHDRPDIQLGFQRE